MELGEADIEQHVTTAMETQGPLEPIAPEVERLLGPVKPVDDVLATLDEQYRREGRPAVYFLKPDEPIAPHLAALLSTTRDSLGSQGLDAYFDGFNARAVALLEAAVALNGDQDDAEQWSLTNRMNRGAALRDLGALEQARDDLKQTAADMKQDADTTPAVLGHCHIHLALCEFLLGNSEAAKLATERSLDVYNAAPDDAPVPPRLVEQSRQLLADLEAGKEPPPRKEIDVEAELRRAREALAASQQLATLPLEQPIAPRLEDMLGPARSTAEVLAALDAQYRQQGKPPVWFLPPDEPISPHLDELLGPVKE